jgi:hypothetical protein
VLLEWNRKIAKEISKILEKLSFYQQNVSLGALLDF